MQPDDLALEALAAATPREAIHSKPGRGASGRLSYVTARFVMDRLDSSVGPGNWQDRYEDRPDGSVRCGIGIRFGDEWVWKWDVGTESDIESEKGVHSDAFKRAGVKWGIARDLYDGGTSAPIQAAPAARPTTPRPVLSTVPPEPEWIAETTAVEQARTARATSQPIDEGSCPVHGKAWRENARGFYCSGKAADGSWCAEKPSPRWVSGRAAVGAVR